MFVFYDFETSGLSPAFDQPLQFAAILTDDDLDEVERVNIRCRLSPFILPSPMALAITGVTPEMMTDDQLPSLFEFTQHLSAIVSDWGPATWVGYNSIQFDENVLRQAFYQNLHPSIYQTQLNGNDRMDLMKMVHAVWELQRDALEWPENDSGNISFKLDQLAPANGFEQHDAHDALGDVLATIHLTKIVRDRAREVWEQALQNRSKQNINELLETGRALRLVERFGARPPQSYVGAFAGRNPNNPNSIGFLDLAAVDPRELTDDDAIAAAVSGTPKLIRTVSINNFPSIYQNPTVTPEITERAIALAAMPDFHARVGQALADRFADAEAPEHVEEQIYSGFPSRADGQLLRAFQEGDWPQRMAIIGQLEDVRFKQLGRRIMFADRPELLSDEERTAMEQGVLERWSTAGAPWTTFAKVDEGMEEVRASGLLSDDEIEALVAFYDGLNG